MIIPINPTILTICVYALGLVAIILLILIIRLQLRMKRLLVGKNAHSLEDSFVSITKDLKEFQAFTKDMEQYLVSVEHRLKRSIQSVETVRFNPFKGTGSGGNQSFSAAFVNEKGDGVVLTSMYARDRISMFAKPLKAFGSEFELSEEEKEALETSKKNVTT